jgi:hypothetical protein
LWPRAPIKIVIFKMVDRLKLAKATPKKMWNRLNIAVSSLRSIKPVTTQHRAIRYGSFRLRDRQLYWLGKPVSACSSNCDEKSCSV